MDHQNVGAAGQDRDRDEGFDRVVVQLVEPGTDRVRDRDDQQRVAVGKRVCRRFGADHAAGAAAVVDHHLLAEPIAQLLRDHAPDHVVAAAGRERNDEPHRLARIVLGHHRRGERQRGERQQETRDLDQQRTGLAHAIPPGIGFHATVSSIVVVVSRSSPNQALMAACRAQDTRSGRPFAPWVYHARAPRRYRAGGARSSRFFAIEAALTASS